MRQEGYQSWFRLDHGHVPDMQIGTSLRIIARPSEECGCPEEEWLYEGIYPLLLHFEEDGSGEVTTLYDDDGGGYQHTITGVSTIEELRDAAFAWMSAGLADRFEGHRV